MGSHDGEKLIVAFEGSLIECDSLPDAMGIKAAEDILDDGGAVGATASQLQQLRDTLRRYNLDEAAERISRLLSRIQAIDLMTMRHPYDGDGAA